jgi:Cytochrome c7 and related cytochrome c
MTSKKELQLAYRLAIVLFVIGFLCFAAFSAKPPETPVRVVYKTNAGKVLFDHKTHAAETGYGMACTDCHHHPGTEGETPMLACGACHPGTNAPAEQLETIAQACNECHDPDDYELEEVMPRADAFHGQCISCHKDFEAGPQACASCHVI